MKSFDQSTNAISQDFSGNGAYYAEAVKTLASYRIRIWETGSSNLICSTVGVDGDNLSCACWNHSTDQASLCIALGLENGEISIFSVAQKKSVATLKKHSAKINDFIFSRNGISGYSCSEDGLVVEWDLKSNTAKRELKMNFTVLKLKLNHSESNLAICGTSIHIYSTDNLELKTSWSGHSTDIVDVVFSANDRFCLSLAKEERSISVWDMQDQKSVLTIDSEIKSIDISDSDEVLAVDEFGLISFWESPSRVKVASKKKKSKNISSQAIGNICIVDSEQKDKKLPIYSASFSDQKVLILRNSLVRPIFEIIDYKNADGDIQSAVLERASTKGLLINNDKKPEIPGPVLMGTSSLNIQSGSNQVSTAPKVFGDLSMEEKLNLLAIQPEPSKPLRAITSVSSLHQLLSQAITSLDKELLDRCLRIRDRKMISSTVSRLEPVIILPLLRIIIGRCQTKPNDNLFLLEWIRSCLVLHSSYLLSLDQVSSELSDLYSVLESRISNFESLLKLSGRLDGILIHGTIESNFNQEPMLEFDETVDIISEKSDSEGENQEFSESEEDSDENLD